MLTVSVLPGPPPDTLGEARVTNAWEDDAGQQYARAKIAPDGCWLEWDGLGAFRFCPPEREVMGWAAPGVERRHLLSAFERFLQPVALQALGHPVLHASGVLGPSGDAIAFCGLSGSGKSTIAYGFSRLGYQQLADDALVLSLSNAAVMVHPSAFAPRLRPSAIAALSPSGPGHESGRRPTASHLGAIVILTQALGVEEPVRMARVPRHLAFARVLTHAHAFDPQSPTEAARLSRDYLDIVERVPVFDATYRPDFSHLPEVLTAIGGAVSTR